MTVTEQAAALVALLRERPNKMTWSQVAVEVAFRGDAREVWDETTSDGALVPDPRLGERLDAARRDVVEWQAAGLRLVTVLDQDYPQRLLDIREAPPFLFASGQLCRQDPGMSVVGSRTASDQGRSAAATAARLLVDRGLTVVSGLAAGIDRVAHRSALEAGGRTVALLGTGIDRYYPAENRELQDLIAHRGLVLSQFWPGAAPTRQSFPMRNATMSGYGIATIVIEASEHSGTRIQARKAVEHGRPVILTNMVTEQTQWGAALVGRPGVHVATHVSELERVIDQVLAEQDALEVALQGLSNSQAA